MLRIVLGADWAIEATGITKRYGETVALDQVDLRVAPGEIHGLLGPNGAGKSTLLSCLFGLTRPDEGTMRLFGRSQPDAAGNWLDGVGGFVETPRFYPYLTGRRNLQVLAGLDGGDADALVSDVLDLVGLSAFQEEKVRGYSLGMRQRLGVAAALLRRPRLLILDEPTNGMDPLGTRELCAALRQLAQNGLTVLLSSHNMLQVEEICATVTVLNQGTMAFAGSLDTMRSVAPDPAWRLHTTDDPAALIMAQVDNLASSAHPEGIVVWAAQEALDDFVIRLGEAKIAVRGLSLDVAPLEALFFRLTEPGPAGQHPEVR